MRKKYEIVEGSEITILTICGYILAYGISTAAGVLIAWPIIEWFFSRR